MKKALLTILAYILSPFVKLIRYGALKLMKAMHRPDDRRPAMAAASHLLEETTLPFVFRIFQEKEFRRLARFEKLPVSEHDRIFNELEVAGICMLQYSLAEAKQYVKDGSFHFWSGVEEELSRQLQKILESFGISSSNAKLMRELVNMRWKEYEKFADQVWQADALMAVEVKESINKKFKGAAPEIKRLLSTVHAFAFGTVDHIRRGKIEERDLLVRHLMTRLLILHNKISRFVRKL